MISHDLETLREISGKLGELQTLLYEIDDIDLRHELWDINRYYEEAVDMMISYFATEEGAE